MGDAEIRRGGLPARGDGDQVDLFRLFHRQADALQLDVELDNLDFDQLSDLDDGVRIGDEPLGQLGDVDEAVVVDANTFPQSSAERQLRLTFIFAILRSGAGLLPSFQGDVGIFSMMARFLRLFSRYGGSLSSSTS